MQVALLLPPGRLVHGEQEQEWQQAVAHRQAEAPAGLGLVVQGQAAAVVAAAGAGLWARRMRMGRSGWSMIQMRTTVKPATGRVMSLMTMMKTGVALQAGEMRRRRKRPART